MQILSTLIAADGGQAQVAGHDVATAPDRVRAAIGVTGQFAALDDLLTAEENLLLMADLLRLGKREGRLRAASCWSGSVSPTSLTSGPPPSPAVCGAGSTSP